jgi:ABC-type transport system substrate-binding protein
MFPAQIGRYEIKAELGRGGMATVYRAYDPRFRREVALKVLPREFLHDPQFRARFEREAQTIATLEHSAIVPVYDYGEDAEAGQPYLVMRLMTGGSLADRLEAGPLPLAEVARIFSRLAAALDRAHSKGIIHRDLKPGNILFDADGDPYISDFGIAKLTQATSASLTGSGALGTPAYMSPEQARGEKNLDGRSDIYAMGAILFQMLTGKFPYEADTPMAVVLKHILDPVPDILATRPDLPREIGAVVQSAMAKKPEERFAHATDMAHALETVARATATVPSAAVREAEQAERERLARERAEAERLAQEKAERLAALRAEEERLTREQAEAVRTAKEKAEAERLVRAEVETPRPAAPPTTAARPARGVSTPTIQARAPTRAVVTGLLVAGGLLAVVGVAVVGIVVYPALFGETPGATQAASPPVAAAPSAAPPQSTASAPTAEPGQTTAPEPTAVPTRIAPTPNPQFVGMQVSAIDCSYGGEIKSIEAVDEFTVRLTLCAPDPALPAKLTLSVFGILNKDDLDAYAGDSARISEQPNGTGPYVLKEWARGDYITFEANPNYWGEPPRTRTVIFRWSSDPAARLTVLAAGEADGLDTLSSEEVTRLQGDSGFRLYLRPPINIFYIGLNNTQPPLDDERVRQALAMAIDREAIVESLYPGTGVVAEQFVPPDLYPGFSTSGDGAQWYTYDPAAARQLLAEAGYPDGFEITLPYRDVVRAYLPDGLSAAQAIQADLARIGVKVNLIEMETGPFLESVSANEQPMFLLGWVADFADSSNFYDAHFLDASSGFGAPYDDLVAEITAAVSLSDPAQRQQHYDRVNALIKQRVPVIPVAHNRSAVAFRADVDGVAASPFDVENFARLSSGADQLVWLQGGEPASLWCADESDGYSFQACAQIYDTLVAVEPGSLELAPGLAQSWEVNADATEWTFYLRPGVLFHNGATLDANDVVATLAAQWDAQNPNHTGSTGAFDFFLFLFGNFLNAP